MPVSLTNSNDIIANSVSLITNNDVINMFDLFYKNNKPIEEILGLPPATLNTLQKLAESKKHDLTRLQQNHQIKKNKLIRCLYNASPIFTN